jgi:PhnB protein
MPVPEAAKAKIIHSSLHFGDGVLFASDSMPGGKAPTTGGNIALSVAATSYEAGLKMFEALAEGGTITMPFAKQFWGDTFGMLVDKFGNAWMVNAS